MKLVGQNVRNRNDNENNSTSCVELVAPPRISTPNKQPKADRIMPEFKFVLLALVLVVSILLGTAFRLVRATPYITYNDISDFTNVEGEITDRFDQTIYKEGKVNKYEIFGNLIGYKDLLHNTLVYRHSDLLISNKVNPFIGHRSLETKSRIMKTTLLSEESQEVIVKLFGDKKGCCFAYNYETGEVYTALSLPQYNPEYKDSEYYNRCFDSVYIPGSTMKIVTTALAIDQGKDMSKITYTCKGSINLTGEKPINCTGVHGTIGTSTAISTSCNCFFAQLIWDLNLEKALESLKKMGFEVNVESPEKGEVDGLSKKTSTTNMTNTASFKNIWGLIGQGNTEVNPIDMAKIAAAVVSKGEAVEPYIISSVINPNKNNKVIYKAETEKTTLMSSKTAEKTAEFWKKGVDRSYYTAQGMNKRIDYAKTGTAQRADKTEDKLLIGVIESSKTAFYIVIEDCKPGGLVPMTIANKLADLLPNN